MAVPARQVRRAPARVAPRPATAWVSARGLSRRRGWVPFLVVSAAVVGSMVTALVSMQALVAQRSFDVHELQRQAEELGSDYVHLRAQLAELSDPGRIEAAARKAGLVPQERIEVLEVPPQAVPGPRRAVASAGGAATLKAALGAGG